MESQNAVRKHNLGSETLRKKHNESLETLVVVKTSLFEYFVKYKRSIDSKIFGFLNATEIDVYYNAVRKHNLWPETLRKNTM